MKKTTEKETSETPMTRELVITSAEQMAELLKEPLYARFFWRNKPTKIPVLPLSPATSDAVRELRRKALPPFKRERGPQGGYDELDPGYLKQRDENDRKARALIIYTHCPVVSGMKTGLTAIDEIYKFVQTLWTENILEIIALGIQEGGISMEERVDFTSAGGSES